MKDLNKKMTDFIQNKGSKLGDNFYENDDGADFDLHQKLVIIYDWINIIFKFRLDESENTKEKTKKKYLDPKKPVSNIDQNYRNSNFAQNKKERDFGRFAKEDIISPDFYPKNTEKHSKDNLFSNPNSKVSKISNNLEYNLHENKSDYNEEYEKKSYISVKLEPKVLESNASSPLKKEELTNRKQQAPIFRPGNSDFLRNNNFASNLTQRF